MSNERKAEVEASFEPAATIEERRARIKRAREEVRRICQNPRQWRMCIPVQPDDTDIVLSAALRDAKASLDELEYAQAEVKGERITNEFIEAERDAYRSDAARLADKWASVPWEALGAIDDMLRTARFGPEFSAIFAAWGRLAAFLHANAPQRKEPHNG